MELNQVSYFINLAETLNFTAAARLSGVSQPSLTRAIRRLEDELGGPLIYRDGKNSRLTDASSVSPPSESRPQKYAWRI
jgi:DNA-binding transcriptional LysR family regulator